MGGGREAVSAVRNAKDEAYNMRRQGMAEANRDAAKSLKGMLKMGKGGKKTVSVIRGSTTVHT